MMQISSDRAAPTVEMTAPVQAMVLVLLGLTLTAISLAAIGLAGFGGFTTLWPTYALALVAILRGPPNRGWRLGVYAAFTSAILATVLIRGGSPSMAVLSAFPNLVELVLAVFLIVKLRLTDSDLTRPSSLFTFLACAAFAAPIVAAALAIVMTGPMVGVDFSRAWLEVWLADALGVMIIAPFGLAVTRERLNQVMSRHDRLVALAFFAALTAACLYLAPRGSTQLALLAPIAVLATLRFGVLGAAVAVLWSSVLIIGINLAGFGVLGGAGVDMRAELYQLQLGLAVLPLATLPVAAVLAQRDRALQAAAAAERARSVFLTNMSHEVRTPLNGVIGMAELLSRSATRARDREIASTIRSSGEALERLLSDVLDLARMESGESMLDDAAFDLACLANDVAQVTRAKLAGRPVTLVVELESGLQGLRRGPELCVRQVLCNLMDNAAKVTESGSITLSIQPEGDADVRFSVRDTGPGFDPALAQELFGAFAQADGTLTRRIGGAGVGLAIVRHLVEDMHGTLGWDGRPGEGATFEVVLPLPREADAPARPEPRPELRPEPAPELPPELAPEAVAETARAPRVLMAEDNAANRRVIELILGATDIQLTSVENGAEAVAAFAADAYDVVLMDVQMPVMDGLAAVREIRRLETEARRPATPILMLTANALPEHRAASAAAGADAHLTKPVSTPTLLGAIQSALAGDTRVLRPV